MAMALAAYAGTMATALAVLVALWNGIIGPPQLERIQQQPHAVVHVVAAVPPTAAEAALPEQPGRWGPAVVHRPTEGVDVASVEDARVAAAKQAAAIKARHVRLARDQKRRDEVLARQREQQDYTTAALGYAQERPQLAQQFGLFNQSRF
jgi:predicted transcriptional regulator